MSRPEPPSVELVVPSTEDDFRAIGRIKAATFGDKSALCCGGDPSDGVRAYRTMARRHPDKLRHGRAARLVTTGEIVGLVQLQLPKDVGDLEFPVWARHECRSDEAYIEQIATSPQHQGKGIGSRLLQWANDFALERNCRRLTLHVMSKNSAAIRLYQRKGFVIQDEPSKSGGRQCCIGIMCFVCSCGKYFGAEYMVKMLNDAEGDLEGTSAPAAMAIPRDDPIKTSAPTGVGP